MMENSNTTTLENQPRGKRIFRDTLVWGFIIGFTTPFLALIVYYYAKIAPNSWSDFFRFLTLEKRLLSSLTVVCLIPNIALFTLFINTKKDQIAKGIFGVTVVFAIASLLIKFLG